MFLLGIFLFFAATAETSRIVDNWIVEIEVNVLIRVTPTAEASDHLDLSEFPVSNLNRDCFARARGLKSLKLQITLDETHYMNHLPPLVFRHLSELKKLSLVNSEIGRMQYAFWGLSKLQVLDLRNSKIDLEEGSFFGISSTVKILLAGSNVLAVEPKHFFNPRQLLILCWDNKIVQSLDLFRNETDMDEQCDMAFVKKHYDRVILYAMNIEGFKKGWYRSGMVGISQLSLSTNRITDLSSNLINDLPKDLQMLDLSWNMIKSVEYGKINNRNLRVLDLTGNPITRIDSGAFIMTNLRKLVLTLSFTGYLPSTLEDLTLLRVRQGPKFNVTMVDLHSDVLSETVV